MEAIEFTVLERMPSGHPLAILKRDIFMDGSVEFVRLLPTTVFGPDVMDGSHKCDDTGCTGGFHVPSFATTLAFDMHLN